jgi:hypothetical protein
VSENKFFIEADIKVDKETAARKEKASKVIELPPVGDKQPDLLYFSAIFVSSGENLNHAYFLGSELVAAEGTIINKALDVEHSEDEIIGHIYERAFMTKEGEKLEVQELASKETASLDAEEMHVAIAGIIYKNRFPNIAQEVADNKWKVSMECYYTDFDVKIGNLIMDRKSADALGLASASDDILGKTAKVIKKGKEIAEGHIARVLRGICFSGCGIVKNPANPPSVIMETAKNKIKEQSDTDVIILNYDELHDAENANNNLTSLDTEEAVTDVMEEARDGMMDDTTGICVNFKKYVYDKSGATIAENYCSAFEQGCTSFSRDTTDPDCLRNQAVRRFARAFMEELASKHKVQDRRKELLDGLKAALREAVKTQSR